MQTRRFGPIGSDVAIVGQGTWKLDNADRTSAVAALRCGLDLGMTHIDTAEIYGHGEAEELVAEAISGRRDEVFLVSKVAPENASRSGTIQACERSLKHLRTDRLDCYLLHWRGSYPLTETIAAFAELKQAGKIRAWGVSNFDVGDLDEVLQIAGEGQIACNQVLYHPLERAVEHDVLAWCEAHDVALVAYSPFSKGRFPKPDTAAGTALAEVAQAHNATARQVALAFLARNPSVFVIPKASSVKHAEENAGAGDLLLSENELASLDAAFPRGPRPRHLPMF